MILKKIKENENFVIGLLHKPAENKGFFNSKERFLLQGVVGILDELSEVEEETEKIKQLTELGDVLFYVTVFYYSLSLFMNPVDATMLIDKIFSNPTFFKGDPKIKLLSLSKKVCFQESIHLLSELCASFCCILKELTSMYTDEEISQAFDLMRKKLESRYPDGFSPKASKERTI